MVQRHISKSQQFPVAMSLLHHKSVVRHAWDVAGSISTLALKLERNWPLSHIDKIFLRSLKSTLRYLERGHKEAFFMEMAPAQVLWLEVQSLPDFRKNFPEMKIYLKNGPLPVGASKMEYAFWDLTKALVDLFDALARSADPSPMDQDSPDYNELLDWMEPDPHHSKLVHGRKALYLFFEG